MEKAKTNFYANIILENSEDPKKLWKSINNILHRFPAPSLPENLSLKTICEKFSNFFVDKITIIRSKFPDDNELRNVHPSYDIYVLMNTLTLATEAEIKKLIMKSKSTSSDLDQFPTSLLKDCLDVLIVPITSIINKSLQEGVFPDQFKKAYIRPLLKKKTLDKNELKNYRPVSNLSFISKILEKVVASRLLSHMESNSMSNNLQSAYKKFHSTESALLKVENDVLLNMEKGRVTALTLLDLSADFDTIDHLTLISRLSSPLLNFLHWLPVKYRIRFKLCTITFKAFLFHQPTYLFNYLVPLQNSGLLRSSNTNMLAVPRFQTKWGSRAVAVAAPSTWNTLPVNLRTASTVTSLKKC